MAGSVILNTLNNGYPGTPSHTPDEIISPHPVDSTQTAGVLFGAAVSVSATGTVKNITGSDTAATFAGVAARVVQTPTSYPDQNNGVYMPGDMAGIVVRGAVSVAVNTGITSGTAPTIGGTVYMRIKANETYPNAVIGGFETAADSTNTVALTNAKFSSGVDDNGVAEITILTRQAV